MLTTIPSKIFKHGMKQSCISVYMPRVAQCQQHCANPEFTSVEDFIKKTVAIPFLDHLISDVSSRFTAHSKMAASLQALLLVNITPATCCVNIQEAIDLYPDNLPNPNIPDEEISRWKSKWLSIPQQDRPEILSEALKQCCSETLPNVSRLLRLFATIPLSSCSCEKSASALRHLNTYLRCTQTEEHLTTFALIHKNYETGIDQNRVCRFFFYKYPRIMEIASLLFES